MKLGNLTRFDSSFQVISSTNLDLNVEGITDTYLLALNHLLFIKNKNVTLYS